MTKLELRNALHRQWHPSRTLFAGATFNHWTVIDSAPRKLQGDHRYYQCRCTCGVERWVRGGVLLDGGSKSCGCVAKARRALVSGSREYRTWRGMIQRCTNPNSSFYRNYGGRGIKVCDRWLASFDDFIADVGRSPSREHSIDRYPDTNGNYEPGNVRWATPIQQQNNTTKNRHLTHAGETLTIAEWAHRFGLPRHVFANRIKLGWAFDDAARIPVRKEKLGAPRKTPRRQVSL